VVEARFAPAGPGRHRLWSRPPPPGWPPCIQGMRPFSRMILEPGQAPRIALSRPPS